MFSMFSCWIYLQKAKNLLPFSFFFFFFFFFLWSAVSAQYFSSSDFSFPLDETTFSIDNKLFYVKTGLVFFGSGGVPYSLNLTSPNGTMVSLFANENVVQQSSGQFMTFYDPSNTSLSSVPWLFLRSLPRLIFAGFQRTVWPWGKGVSCMGCRSNIFCRNCRNRLLRGGRGKVRILQEI